MFQAIKNLFQQKNKDFQPRDGGLYQNTYDFLWLRSLSETDYLRLYKTWVFASTSVIADTVSNQDFVFLTQKWGKSKADKNFDLITPDLLKRITSFMKLSGTCYVYKKVLVWNKIEKLEVLRPDLVCPEYDEFGFVKYYRYTGYWRQYIFYPQDLIVFKNFSPFQSYTIDRNGVWEMEAVALEAETDNATSLYNNKFYQNNATPSWILSTDQNLEPSIIERILTAWNNKNRGVNNSHKTAVLTGGLKYQGIAISQKEMEMVEQRRFTRDEILAIFKVPKSMLWLSENVNVWNVKAFDYVFMSKTIQPICTYIASVFNETLLKGIWYMEFVNVVPLDDEVLQNDLNSWVITINEYRVKKWLPKIEGWDVLKLNSLALVDAGKIIQEKKEVSKSKFSEIIKKSIKDKTEQKKQARWEQKIKRNDEYEEQYKKQFLKIFEIQEKDVLKQLKSVKEVKAEQLQLKLDDVKYLALYHLFIWPTQDELVKKEWQIAFDEINVQDFFKIWDPQIKKYLFDNIEKFWKEIDKTTKEKILAKVDEGLQQWLGASEITTMVKDVFKELKTSRLEMIVRTETIRASDYATRTAWEESNVVEGKEWFTALDERVCQHCWPMNGKIIWLKEDFFKKWSEYVGANGWVLKLDYESVKWAPLHPRCRCTLLPILKED